MQQIVESLKEKYDYYITENLDLIPFRDMHGWVFSNSSWFDCDGDQVIMMVERGMPPEVALKKAETLEEDLSYERLFVDRYHKIDGWVEAWRERLKSDPRTHDLMRKEIEKAERSIVSYRTSILDLGCHISKMREFLYDQESTVW